MRRLAYLGGIAFVIYLLVQWHILGTVLFLGFLLLVVSGMTMQVSVKRNLYSHQTGGNMRISALLGGIAVVIYLLVPGYILGRIVVWGVILLIGYAMVSGGGGPGGGPSDFGRGPDPQDY